MKTPRYETEAALCADFIAWVKASAGKFNQGVKTPVWTPYAETADWDILLVAEDGTQIGVQAKLKFNMKVLAQSIPDSWDDWRGTGPDYRAVLVPEHNVTHERICAALGLKMIARQSRSWGPPEFSPGLDMAASWCGGWHYWSPAKHHVLPEFVPDVTAGASGPVQLTKWKIAALRIVATLDVRGHVTRQDFRNYGVDPRRWTGPGGWLKTTEVPGQYVRGDGLDFDRQHPDVYAQILAEVKAKHAPPVEHGGQIALTEAPA